MFASLVQQWYDTASRLGRDKKAQSALALLHLEGRGLPQSDLDAVKLMQKSAGQNFAEAQK
jgi:TPR repeat protein